MKSPGGLTEPEVKQLVGLVQTLKTDLAIIWIEHIAHALVATADRIAVLHFGKKLLEGGAAGGDAKPRGPRDLHGDRRRCRCLKLPA